MWDRLYHNANILTRLSGADYHIVESGAVAVKDGLIQWIGQSGEAQKAKDRVDLKGQWLLPGLIDCHTHLVFAGDRSLEFEMRQQGASYESIAQAGGGILNTVQATRQASFDELYDLAAERLQAYLRQGVTTLEIKSGYGLNLETERKQLKVARKLGEDFPINIRTTFLGAHALPPEYQGEPDRYVDYVCQTILPAVADEGLADYVDVFTESIGFNLEQTEQVMCAAEKHQLKIKCHAEQLSRMGATELACRHQAVSVDHVEYINEQDVQLLQSEGTTPVLLPAAFYYLKETQKPPIQLLRQYDVPMALATDFNPGSAPTNQLLLVMNMASVLWQMTPQEVLRGVTEYAARALGLENNVGTIQVGMQADMSVWDVQHPRALVSQFTLTECKHRIYKGRLA